MFDLLTQLWLSTARRTLIYGIAIMSLGMGVAAFVCLGALSGSFVESLKQRVLLEPDEGGSTGGLEFTLVEGPTIRIEVWPKKGRLDAERLNQRVRRATGRDVASMTEAGYDVKVGRHAFSKMRVVIISGDWLQLHPHFAGVHELIAGRSFTTEDDRSGEAVCIVNTRLASALPKSDDPVGQTLKVNGRQFRVVGVVRDDGNYLNGSLFISFSAAYPLLRIQPPQSVSFLSESNETSIQSDMSDVEFAVLRELGPDYVVTVGSPWLDLEGMRSQLNYTRLFLGLISLLPLVVGLLGMVSMLLANLNSRVREIGVHRALGATRLRQATLVLCEAGMTGLLACLIGIPVGTGVLHLLSSAWCSPLRAGPGSVPVAVLASVLTAVLAGVIPARAAMRISPCDALRAE